MRVAHIITRMIVGGAQENTLYSCEALADSSEDEVLLVTGPALGPEGDLLVKRQEASSKVLVKVLDDLRRNIQPVRDWKAYGQIRDCLQQWKPDVVHTHSAKAGILGRKAAWSLGIPAVVHTVHGAPFHPFQPWYAREVFIRCERYAAKKCHQMISVADAMTDLMVDARVAPREKFTTIYSGMDVEPFREANQYRDETRSQFGLNKQHIVIGKIARLFHLKGHDDLIDSAAEVIKHNTDVHFLLVGDGILRDSLIQKMERLGIRDHFHLSGLVPPSEIPRMIGGMDILVHTSLREGLARALPQALIAGLPCVSYDVDGAREVVLDQITGRLVPVRDTETLADALTDLASDQEKRERMGREGQLRFTDQFKHQTMTTKLRELYKELLAHNA